MFSLRTIWRCMLSVICRAHWHAASPYAFYPLCWWKCGLIQSAFLQRSIILCRKFLIPSAAQPLLHKNHNVACCHRLTWLISSLPSLLLVIVYAAICLGRSPVWEQPSRNYLNLHYEEINWTFGHICGCLLLSVSDKMSRLIFICGC